MKEIKKGFVLSEDIERILNGINAFDYKYDAVPNSKIIENVRKDFKNNINQVFDNVTIVTEEEMLEVNKLIGGEYPHCYSR
ncbi:MAG: hypothetical protein IKF36_06595 [Bacilli bacterium]|jgi:hypothetical protein|nr:hypothetical protein [Bacilli bacterium]